MEETAVNQAHQHASTAEEQEERGLLAEAIEAHTAAAEKFLVATQDTQNTEVIRTLKLMNAKHLRQAKDLQRRVAKQAAADAAAAAEIARKSGTSRKADNLAPISSASGDGGMHPGTSGRRRSSSEHQHHPHYHHRHSSQQHHYHRHQHPVEHSSSTEHTPREPKVRAYRPTSKDLVGTAGDSTLPGTLGTGADTGSSSSYIGSSEASSNSSSAMIEESYTLIRDHVKDESDPFNKFWDAVENLVLKISSPVAFTSIPLTADDLSYGSAVLQSPSTEDPPNLTPTSPTEVRTINLGPFVIPSNLTQQSGHHPAVIDLSSFKEQTRKVDLHKPPKTRVDPAAMQESYFIIDSPSATGGSKHISRYRSASESPSVPLSTTSGKRADTASPSTAQTDSFRNSTKTLEEYAIENQQLKLTLDRLSKRNMKLEKHIEGAMQMSVWQKDIQRSALQLIKSQDILRPSASSQLAKQSIQDRASVGAGGVGALFTSAVTNANNAVMDPSTGTTQLSESPNYDQMSPVTMQNRLKELTEELQAMRLENAKQTTLMKKYKQRWEDLKESAKKRRNAGSTSPLTSSLPPSGAGMQVHESGGNLSQGIRCTQQAQHAGINPYSNSSLAENPGSPSGAHSSNSSTRPMITLARSSSASGPVLTAGGTYQRRILMESNKAGQHLGAHHVGAVGSPSLPRVPEALTAPAAPRTSTEHKTSPT